MAKRNNNWYNRLKARNIYAARIVLTVLVFLVIITIPFALVVDLVIATWQGLKTLCSWYIGDITDGFTELFSVVREGWKK